MPPRLTPLITSHYYHIFNRTIDGREIFSSQPLCELFLALLFYYRSVKRSMSHSFFQRLDSKKQKAILRELSFEKYFKIDILAYCLMPNHFHFLVKLKQDGGISKYISDVLNAFTRHFNLKNKRKGPLFLPRFQAQLIVSREQFIHVSRYIHLNPYSGGVISKESEILYYPWSSMREYVMSNPLLAQPKAVLAEFNEDKEKYKKFIFDNAEHQRSFENVKYMRKW